jgi:molecular chaperone Hsp33
MKDYLVKALAFNDSIRIYCVTSKHAINEVGKRFGYYPSALAAIGRVMSVGIMMGSMLKGDQTVTIKMFGNGPIGHIVVDADAVGNIRGYTENPHVHYEYTENSKLNVKATVGTDGFIHVIKDLKMREPFIGSVPITSGEIAEDFAYYFTLSEQTPSAVSLGVLVDVDNLATHAGGFIIQALPNADLEIIEKLEEILKTLPSISSLLSSGKTPEEIIDVITNSNYIILEKIDVNYKCNCSREKFERGLISLGEQEIMNLIEEDGKVDTVCHFCGNKYHFDKIDLEHILGEITKKDATKECC